MSETLSEVEKAALRELGYSEAWLEAGLLDRALLTEQFERYQAGGTRGAHMVAGAREVKIHGQWIEINAKVSQIDSYSAHADADEIMAWLRKFRVAPSQVYLCHGEPEAADALRQRIEEQLGWPARVPEHMERVDVAL